MTAVCQVMLHHLSMRHDCRSTHLSLRKQALPHTLPQSPLTLYAAMQESLGGNAKTTLVIAVANALEHMDETLQSLQFGSRAMRVITRAVVNERVDFKSAVAPEILAQLEQTENQATALEASLQRKEEQIEQMQDQLKVVKQ